MNFKNFYSKTQNRLKDSVLSLWATGDASMQQYFSHILDEEGLMAEPVFQTAFPWESADIQFGQANHIFNNTFIDSLHTVKNEDYRFSKERKPYKHQIESWDALINQKKSIAVTTGTGSGKTECFMLPVLYDLFTNCRNSNGINAIFLYPLNALIGSQKKRMDAWCRALGGINYAVYNGNTDENAKADEIRKKLPELISRKQIREAPPQILFTNPSMLEYILVRNKDVNLLQRSKGSLRWILLDEAHTLTGSLAAEMALLIRRIIDAFEVGINQLRFAITSATVGNNKESEVQLKRFMADLCGIAEANIKVVSGKRVLSQQLVAPIYSVKHPSDITKTLSPESFTEVHQLRKDILSKNALPLSNIGKRFHSDNLLEQLSIIDLLSERNIDGSSILPVRGHFFARGIGGVFVCTNPGCSKQNHVRPSKALGTMTTIAGGLCKCGSPLLELTACRSCSNQLIEAERIIDRKTGVESLRLVTAITQDAFLIESADEDDDEVPLQNNSKFYFTKRFKDSSYIHNLAQFTISNEGEIRRGAGVFVEANNGSACPHCGANISDPVHFRLSSSFINRVLADILLEETPEAEKQTQKVLWRGHKYISFTDSRQGTAKIAALINQDNEASWLRSHTYHKLCDQVRKWREDNPEIPKEELYRIINQLEAELAFTTIPVLRAKKLKDIEEYKALLNKTSHNNSASLTWADLKNYLITLSDFTKLFEGTNPNDTNPNGRTLYLNAILYDQFARRRPRERSLENLGMVSIIYPKLDSVSLPLVAQDVGIELDEWKSLLKIVLDYNIRYPFHFFVSHEIYPYTTSFIRSEPIFNPDTQQTNVKRWPIFEKKNIRQNRLALLICAGLGFHEREEIDVHTEDKINELLETIWRTLKSQVLNIDGEGFKLNLEELRFQLSKNLWLCPVKKRLLDAQFKGFSPWITGNLTSDNIRHYKIEKKIQFPEFPYPFNMDEEKNLNLERTREWIESNTKHLRKEGVWNDLHEQSILNRPLYLSGEHSAQQNERRLKDLEEKFENSEVNILNCSTTMEMGVDIGGISAVVMNNVPPSPANYLQRAGRAGRRAEAKSLAFTICSPNPVGLNAIKNPMWALNHPIAPPLLSFKSEMVIERHVNAFFLGKFVQTEAVQGLNVKGNVQSFFFKEEQPLALLFSNWMLSVDINNHETALKGIVKNTFLEDKSFSFLLEKTIHNFQRLSDKTHGRKNGLQEKLEGLMQEFGNDSPAYKAVFFQKTQFLEKNAIGYLAEESFLPSAGLPTGVVEFDTINIDDIKNKRVSKSKPSYFITLALSEFAPGNQIVIDGKSYTSEGIILKSDRGVQAEREIIQSCTHCGYQRILELANNEDVDTKCPHCEHNSFVGINFRSPDLKSKSFSEMIQPAGFAVDIYKKPNRKINEVSSVQYVDPILINIKPWQTLSTSLYDTRESEGKAEILFYNMGSGDGYTVCMHCGRTASDTDQLIGHKRLRGGKNNDNDRNALCSGNDNSYAIHHNVILGGRFKTDFCEIRFKEENNIFSKDESLLYTLGTVLSKELSHYLAVEEGEIDFGIKRYDQFSTIFIFDTAKGGAGYSPQFSLYAEEIFKIAKQKLSHCDCGKACTKCLIDRKTQWHLDKLDRQLALSWLEKAIELKVPDEYLNAYPNLKVVIGSIKDEVGRFSYANKIKEIWLYGSSDIQFWDFERMQLINKIKNKSKINFVFDEDESSRTIQDKISLIQLSAWSSIWRHRFSPKVNLRIICKILTDENILIEYLAADFEKSFNEKWGSITKGLVYKNPDASESKLDKIEIKIDEQSVFEVIIDEANAINSNQIADLFLNKLTEKFDLKSLMQKHSFNVEYVDRYLRTPLGCILMVQFISKLSNVLNFDIGSFAFKGLDFQEDRWPYLLYHNFKNANDRNNAVIKFAEQMGISSVSAANQNLPHYRFFQFSNENLRITIRPDAGIEYGWFINRSSNKYFDPSIDANHLFGISKQKSNSLLYTVTVENLRSPK